MPRTIDDKLMWDAYDRKNKFTNNAIEAAIKAYINGEKSEQELIEEGIWDRLKARGAKAGLKSIPSRLKGAAQTAIGKAGGAVGGEAAKQIQQIGRQTTAAAKAQKLDAKSLSLVNSHLRNLNKVLQNFENDLTKLGMDPETIKKTNPEAAAALTSIKTALASITNAFEPGKSRASAVSKLQQKLKPSAPAPSAAPANLPVGSPAIATA